MCLKIKLNFCQKVSLFLFFLFFMTINPYIKFFAVDKNQKFKIPVHKTLCLYKKGDLNHKINWSSDNESIATVDKNGFVFAKKIGDVTVISHDNTDNSEHIYKIHVIDSDPILGVSISKNVNNTFKIVIVTEKNINKLKLVFLGKNISKTTYLQNPISEGNYYVWESNIDLNQNSFTMTAFANIENEWCTNYLGYTEYDVTKKKVSNAGLNFIASCEGCRSNYYFDCAENASIGYGKLILFGTVFQDNMCKTLINCEFYNSLKSHEDILNKFLNENNLTCNQHQFDALMSFLYNIGHRAFYSKDSCFRKVLLNCKDKNLDFIDKNAFIEIFLKYHHQSKKCVGGLMARRLEELDLFLYGEYGKFLTFANYKNVHNYEIPQCFLKHLQDLKRPS